MPRRLSARYAHGRCAEIVGQIQCLVHRLCRLYRIEVVMKFQSHSFRACCSAFVLHTYDMCTHLACLLSIHQELVSARLPASGRAYLHLQGRPMCSHQGAVISKPAELCGGLRSSSTCLRQLTQALFLFCRAAAFLSLQGTEYMYSGRIPSSTRHSRIPPLTQAGVKMSA